MIKFLQINGTKGDASQRVTPEGRWAEVVFDNGFGAHTLQLNGVPPLPDNPSLRDDLEWFLFDIALYSQAATATAQERVGHAQLQFDQMAPKYGTAVQYIKDLGRRDNDIG